MKRLAQRALSPAMRRPRARFGGWLDAAMDVLVRGRAERGARRRRVRAAIGHALSFETWRSLVRGQGLSGAEAIELMTGLIATAAATAPGRRNP